MQRFLPRQSALRAPLVAAVLMAALVAHAASLMAAPRLDAPGPPRDAPGPKHPPAIAQSYLAEAETIAKRHPSLAIAHAAVARLASHVGKNVLRAKHLGLELPRTSWTVKRMTFRPCVVIQASRISSCST